MQQKHTSIMLIKNQKKICFVISILLLFTMLMTGCTSTPNSDKLTSENVNVDEYVEGDAIPKKDITTMLWKKEYKQLETHDVVIDKNWDEYICVHSLFIPAKKFTDISEFNNVFINDDDYGQIEKYYNAVGVQNILKSIGTADAEYAQSHLQLHNILTDDGNAYVTSIIMQSIVNQHENGLGNLVKQKSSDEKISLGNTYLEVNSILGEGTKLTSVQQDLLTITDYRYVGENVTIELQFVKTEDMNDNDAVLTKIQWTPELIKKAMKQFLYQK